MALFEDVGHRMDTAYGIYDRPGPTAAADEDFDPTVPDEVPLKPTEMMSTSQLATDRPPIEDEDYSPDNIAQLSKSAAAIAQLVPADQVGYFYKELHSILDSATEKQNAPDIKGQLGDQESEGESGEVESPNPKNKEGEKEVKEETFRRMVREILLEMFSDDDKREFDEFRGSGYSEVEPEPQQTRSSNQEGETLEKLADQMGFSGAPGVRQYIDKILKRAQYFVVKVKPEDMKKLRDFAIGEYTDYMGQIDRLDPEDVVELQQAPQAVNELDSFRFFFVAAFLMPAYQKVSREAKSRIKDQMKALKIPAKLEQTVLNQVTGGAKRDRKGLISKLDRLVASGEVPADQRDEIAQNLDQGFQSMITAGDLSDDLVQKSMDGWSAMSHQKRKAALQQALDQTSEFQEKGV